MFKIDNSNHLKCWNNELSTSSHPKLLFKFRSSLVIRSCYILREIALGFWKADSKIPAQSVPAPGADGNLSLISASPVFAPEAGGKIPAQSVPASGAGGNLSLISASPVFVPEASGKIPAQSVPVSGANGSLSSWTLLCWSLLRRLIAESSVNHLLHWTREERPGLFIADTWTVNQRSMRLIADWRKKKKKKKGILIYEIFWWIILIYWLPMAWKIELLLSCQHVVRSCLRKSSSHAYLIKR